MILSHAFCMSATNRVQSRHDINQAAQNDWATVLLDPIGGHQVDLATEQGFEAIGQVDEAEADGLGEARQQVRLISQSKRLLAVGSSVAKEPNRCSELRLNSATRAG